MAVDTKQKTRSKQSSKDTETLSGLRFVPFFHHVDEHPFDAVEWEPRSASIINEKGEVVFEQTDVSMPAHFSQLATNVVVSKYFKGTKGTAERETSLRQVIGRVADTIADWGIADGYFADSEDGEVFRRELTHLLLHQKMAFNSPVWFNVGVEDHPQCSACFINSVEDTMESILDLAKTEGMLFKYGSGAGVNLSPLRGSSEGMTHGGQASGPVSFMRGYDAFAGVIKSGGKTRRAAKMIILNIDHPDIVDFIECKTREEKKAKALIAQGYDPSFNGEAYASVFFQNANHSVRVTDEFMKAVVGGADFSTRTVQAPHEEVDTIPARDLIEKIAENAWQTGDPGIQYDDTINDWHTCSKTDRIHASNPCSEYMFLNNTACNLASINLMKFRQADGAFDIEGFRQAVRTTITAMEIIVGNASYPTPQIEKNSHDYRPLGLGYSNLGALLMSLGMPYDSDEGRAYAAMVTALMHGEAYRTSAEIAGVTGPFKGYIRNQRPMLRVIRKHANAVEKIDSTLVPATLLQETEKVYDEMIKLGESNGFRNAQATVLAPTGTISFMMDCDTTGIEPDIALTKYKKLVGGGTLKIVNRTVPLALKRLGYDAREIEEIVEYIDKTDGRMQGAPHLKDEHLPVFDCALDVGGRSIDYMGHIKMMAAVQPFLSGAISKTVNMPREATVEDIQNVYIEGWQMGLKAIAIYRDGCKASQPLNTKDDSKAKDDPEADAIVREAEKVVYKAYRRKLPDERQSITHKFSVGSYEGYLTVGLYEDGSPGEIFIVMAKEGSFISGLMDSFATSVSIALQYGVPLKVLVRKFIHTRFEPNGYTTNSDIPIAHSVMDYVFRWLSIKFLDEKPGQSSLFGDPDGGDDDGDFFDGPDASGDGGASTGGGDLGASGGEDGPSASLNGDSLRSTANSSSPKTNGSNGHGVRLHTNSEGKVVLRYNGHANSNGNGNGNGNGHSSKSLEDEYGWMPPVGDLDDNDGQPFFDGAPACPECGGLTIRNGSCHTCTTCGATTGCG